VIPPDANAAFVAAMEDVLEVYTRPHDPDFPVVCLDETSKQLIARNPSADSGEAGHPARHDYEYERNGTANLFMMFAPLEGFRHVKVTDRNNRLDYAQVLKELSDTHFPDAKKSAWCRTISTLTNRRHSTKPFPPPKHAGWSKVRVALYAQHGSWLDMAESELGVCHPNAWAAASRTSRP